MRKSVAHNDPAYRHCGPKHEDPRPSFLGGSLSRGRGKLAKSSFNSKSRQELSLLPGLIPAQTKLHECPTPIIRLFCVGFNIGVHHERARTKSISDSSNKED